MSTNERSLFKQQMIQTPRFGSDNEIIGIKEVPFKLVSYRHVKRIRLLKGCPR